MHTNLAKRLTQIRRHLNLSQEEMAAKAGRSLRGWQAYERGLNVPGGEVFQALHELGFNLNWLVSGEGGMMRQAHPLNSQQNYEQVNTQLDVPDDTEAEELMSMHPEQFWSLFNTFAQVNPAQAGLNQLVIIKRLPELRRWLKRKKERESTEKQLRQETA